MRPKSAAEATIGMASMVTSDEPPKPFTQPGCAQMRRARPDTFGCAHVIGTLESSRHACPCTCGTRHGAASGYTRGRCRGCTPRRPQASRAAMARVAVDFLTAYWQCCSRSGRRSSVPGSWALPRPAVPRRHDDAVPVELLALDQLDILDARPS